MKSSRMKFAKKLKSIRAAGEYLNQDRILQVLSAADEYIPKISNQITAGSMMWRAPQRPEHQIDDATELELVENEIKAEAASGNEENIPPPVNQIPRDSKSAATCGSDKRGTGRKSLGSGFRRPELNSITLFDPKLLEAFELAVGCFRRINDLSTDHDDDVIVFTDDECGMEKLSIQDTLPTVDEQDEDLRIANANAEEEETLSGFEERCPPGGEDSVVFYTTTLRGIRKTFDDCNMIRFLLDSFKVKYYERDVSMHARYREELRRISAADEEVVLPPVLFVKGRCIGGAQRVLGLHERGEFRGLFDGVPVARDGPCGRCDGFRFLVCGGCSGSRRIVSGDGSRVQCLLCNENGLVVCLDCSS